jgi:hypothetical protein
MVVIVIVLIAALIGVVYLIAIALNHGEHLTLGGRVRFEERQRAKRDRENARFTKTAHEVARRAAERAARTEA